MLLNILETIATAVPAPTLQTLVDIEGYLADINYKDHHNRIEALTTVQDVSAGTLSAAVVDIYTAVVVDVLSDYGVTLVSDTDVSLYTLYQLITMLEDCLLTENADRIPALTALTGVGEVEQLVEIAVAMEALTPHWIRTYLLRVDSDLIERLTAELEEEPYDAAAQAQARDRYLSFAQGKTTGIIHNYIKALGYLPINPDTAIGKHTAELANVVVIEDLAQEHFAALYASDTPTADLLPLAVALAEKHYTAPTFTRLVPLLRKEFKTHD